jgi:hypothetical protein
VNTHLKKNRTTIVVIFAMAIIPFAIAWYLAVNPGMLKLSTSQYGELISPPVTTEFAEFKGYDHFSAENLKELEGHWVLINLVPRLPCQSICSEALYKTRQLSLMMGKDISRIRRVAAIMEQSTQSALSAEWQEDAHLLKILVSGQLYEKLAKIAGNPIADGVLLVMDPLGNLMMKYPEDFDPYRVKSDLSKLLKISLIG